MIEIWLGKRMVDRSSVVLVISLRRVIDYQSEDFVFFVFCSRSPDTRG